MAPRKKLFLPLRLLRFYDKLIATVPGLERKGANNPYASLNRLFLSWQRPDL